MKLLPLACLPGCRLFRYQLMNSCFSECKWEKWSSTTQRLTWECFWVHGDECFWTYSLDNENSLCAHLEGQLNMSMFIISWNYIFINIQQDIYYRFSYFLSFFLFCGRWWEFSLMTHLPLEQGKNSFRLIVVL